MVDVKTIEKIDLRPVTNEEVRFFKDNGWVYLPGLISEVLAEELLGRAKSRLGDRVEISTREGLDRPVDFYHDHKNIGRDEDKLFWSVATHPTLGANAARLLGRDSSIRMMTESLAVKLPESRKDEVEGRGTAATDWHQDWHTRGVDRTTLTAWIALDDIPPERGSMRFYEGSHRLGALGRAEHQRKPEARNHKTLPEQWPALRECPLSEPLHLGPGDATIHSAFVVHGAPTNTTEDPRWVYLISLDPGDAIYNGMPQYMFEQAGLSAGDIIDHPNFPVIYEPAQV